MPPGELNGIGAGRGEPVYARAAVLGSDAGRPTIDSAILADAYRRFRLGEGTTDLILVALDAALAQLVPLPEGLTLAGIVAEQPAPPSFSTTLPTVSGAAAATRLIADGELLILDPENGRVLIEPPPEDFMRLQVERHRPRILLGGLHTPAQTQSGRVVDVWAQIANQSELEAAIAGGADGLLIVDPVPFLPEDDEGAMDPTSLLQIAERIGGGELAILADPEDIDVAVLLAVAPRADLRWVLRPERLEQSPDELRLDLLEFGNEPETDDGPRPLAPTARALPRLCALVTEATATVGGFDELFLPSTEIADWTVGDTFDLPRLRILIDGEDGVGLDRALRIGAAGVAVPPDRIAETKDFIREQEY